MEMKNNGGSGLAIASMVLGIVALVMACCFWFISVPFAGQKPGKGMAIAGVVCSIVSLVPNAFLFLGIFDGLL